MKHRLSKGIRLILAAAFLLGSFRGYLALWDMDDPEPKQIYPCPVSSLPEADRQALEKGIYVGTNDELSRLLEDFLS